MYGAQKLPLVETQFRKHFFSTNNVGVTDNFTKQLSTKDLHNEAFLIGAFYSITCCVMIFKSDGRWLGELQSLIYQNIDNLPKDKSREENFVTVNN